MNAPRRPRPHCAAAHRRGAGATRPRLCFLTFDPGTLRTTRFGGFFQGLADRGYVDGQTIVVDYLSADGQAERVSAIAAECLRLTADIIVVTTTPIAQAAKNATRTIPIVMLPLGDPVGKDSWRASGDLEGMSPERRPWPSGCRQSVSSC